MDSRAIKSIATKGLKLQKSLDAYNQGGNQKNETTQKFAAVWGDHLAGHFLSKYDDAESLIWALDSENLNLFVTRF